MLLALKMEEGSPSQAIGAASEVRQKEQVITFCFIQVLNRLDDGHTNRGEQSALLNLRIPMPISSEHTPTDTLRNNV